MTFTLTSPSFGDGEPMHLRHTGDGVNVSPPLAWDGVPAGTRSLALICDDPDAPRKVWVHWVLYGLPPTLTELPEGVPTDPTLPDGSKQGTTDFGTVGYGGPAPPKGSPHRYFFKLYALDVTPPLPAGATKADLVKAMEGHVLAEAELMGTYQR
jgi:Raf kinase inhibitor-like YbhB/YbcL family protein